MNMNNDAGSGVSDHKKVLDAIVLIKNKESATKAEKNEGAPVVDLEAIVRKLTERKKKEN